MKCGFTVLGTKILVQPINKETDTTDTIILSIDNGLTRGIVMAVGEDEIAQTIKGNTVWFRTDSGQPFTVNNVKWYIVELDQILTVEQK